MLQQYRREKDLRRPSKQPLAEPDARFQNWFWKLSRPIASRLLMLHGI
jgi:hypothetical protein